MEIVDKRETALLQAMVGVDPKGPRYKWGLRNFCMVNDGGDDHMRLLQMEKRGLVKKTMTSPEGRIYFKATLAGCRVAGLSEQSGAAISSR